MKVKTFSLLAGAASMLAVTGFANAGITGLYVTSAASNTLTNSTLVGTTYTFYVQYDDAGDRFVNALDGDIAMLGDLFQIVDPVFNSGTDLGPHNAALEGIVANLAADSWVGVNQGAPQGDGDWGDEAAPPAGSGAEQFDNGTAIFGGWFLSAGAAGNTPDANLRVKVMTLTFEGAGHPEVNGIITTQTGELPSGERIFTSTVLGDLMQGSIRFSFNPAGAAAGSIIAGTFVFAPVPAPGALALLGVAGLVGKRRRRA